MTRKTKSPKLGSDSSGSENFVNVFEGLELRKEVRKQAPFHILKIEKQPLHINFEIFEIFKWKYDPKCSEEELTKETNKL